MGFNNRAQRFTGSNYLDVDSPFYSYQHVKAFYHQSHCATGHFATPNLAALRNFVTPPAFGLWSIPIVFCRSLMVRHYNKVLGFK